MQPAAQPHGKQRSSAHGAASVAPCHSLVNLGSEDIHKGNDKLVLGLMW